MTAGTIILILKIAVVAVTGLLAASLVAAWRGQYRLHGRINLVFFTLTLAALLGLEVIVRLINPVLFSEHFKNHNAEAALAVHLSFSLPSAALLFIMLFTGWKRQRRVHIVLGFLFLALWVGTFVTGVFFLPHVNL
jgi:uncharacterized membrane protein YozB (DUF420 family)